MHLWARLYYIQHSYMQIEIKIVDYVLTHKVYLTWQLDLHLKSGADHVYRHRTIFRSHCYTTDKLVFADDLNSEQSKRYFDNHKDLTLYIIN